MVDDETDAVQLKFIDWDYWNYSIRFSGGLFNILKKSISFVSEFISWRAEE